ncbi:hypothetical protein LCGC14_1677430 [marine sediment metagenome]|uniref:Uncharacterized protein n=1 Tax=marine sediment metagenome TaxID=412755 RepID=A0A0F9K5A0_9ZZZZ
MKKETKKKLKILEKHLKTCPECGKEFLGLYISSDRGDYPKYHSLGMEEYKLECGKCPKCQEQCVFYSKMCVPSISSNQSLHVDIDDDNDMQVFVDYVKKFNRMPCDEYYNIFEWYESYGKDIIKKDDLFDDDTIRYYVSDWFNCLHEAYRSNTCYHLISADTFEIFDLFDFFENLDYRKRCIKEGHIPYKEYSYKGTKQMRAYHCERCGQIATNPNYKEEELEKKVKNVE